MQHNDMHGMQSLHLMLKKDANRVEWDSSINVVSVEKEK